MSGHSKHLIWQYIWKYYNKIGNKDVFLIFKINYNSAVIYYVKYIFSYIMKIKLEFPISI